MLKLSQRPLPNQDMDIMVMVMDTILDMAMDTMAKDLLKPSLDMDIMVMGMDMVMAMDMATDTMGTMVRDLLMLKLSQRPLPNQDMDIMVMVMDTILDMAMVTMDTMAKDLLKPSLDMDIMAM